MSRTVYCQKLKKEAEGMSRPMYPGELGVKIFENFSNEAWQMWLKQQTILINEYRINPLDPNARKFIQEQMIQFFFNDTDVELPEQFVPQK